MLFPKKSFLPVVFANLFEHYCKEVLHSKLMVVTGRLQKEGLVTHVIAEICYNGSSLLHQLVQPETGSATGEQHIPKGRNFR